MTVHIAVLATLDTKGVEAGYLADRIRDFGGTPVLVDLGGTDPVGIEAQVSRRDLLALAPGADGAECATPTKIQVMTRTVTGASAAVRQLLDAGAIDAAIAIGGGQGSWLASAVLRPLPLGFPRLLVSTAGRDVGQYTRFADLMTVFSVTDVAGTNPLLRRVLTNAAAAVTGMARSSAWRDPLPRGMVAVSVYGITTAGARVAMAELENAGLTPVSFHANGVGGPTLEAQLAARTFEAVLDWSITEIADEVVGGICGAGPERLTHAGPLGLPQVVVPGGIDVVNFAAPDTVPAPFAGRRLYAHTPEATLMRTDPEENARIARVVAERLDAATAPVRVLIPAGGFSALSDRDGPLADPEADRVFATVLTASLTNPLVAVEMLPLPINHPAFARAAARALIDLAPHLTSDPS